MKRILAIFVFAMGFIIFNSSVSAQICSGSLVCGSRVDRVCVDANGNTCDPRIDPLGCTCTYECGGMLERATCGAYYPVTACEAASICEVYVGVCVQSGSCYLTAPPPTSTPGPTAPPGSCSAGSWCDTVIANCGVKGWVPGGGTCPGGICCTSGGGALPGTCDSINITFNPNNRVIEVGQTLVMRARVQYRPPNGQFLNYCVRQDPREDPMTTAELEFGWLGSNRDHMCADNRSSPDGDDTIVLYAFGKRPGTATLLFTENWSGPMYTCGDKRTTVTVVEPIPDPWWQVIGGDAVSGTGSMRSFVPGGYSLILGNTAGYPGVAVYNGSINVGSGTVSSKRWSANTIYNDTRYSYEKFTELVPDGVTWNDVSRLHSGGVKTGDYEWFRVSGNYALQSNLMINGGRKVILFVSNDLTINANVRLNDVKNDYFMAVTGRNISVANNVTNVAYGGGGSTLPTPTPPSGVPTNLAASCSNGTVSFSWNPVAGASYYPMRIYNTALGWHGCTGTDICPLVSAPTTNYTMAGTPGATYAWWMHSIVDGAWSEAVGGPNVTCSTSSSSCNSTCSPSSPCTNGLTCTNQGVCRNPSCLIDSNCVCTDSVHGRTSTTYALEGIFYADGTFNSGTGSNPLGVRGSVVASSIILGRNLGANNDDTPAETFEFGEENMLLYPKDLVGVTVAWREVAP